MSESLWFFLEIRDVVKLYLLREIPFLFHSKKYLFEYREKNIGTPKLIFIFFQFEKEFLNVASVLIVSGGKCDVRYVTLFQKL